MLLLSQRVQWWRCQLKTWRKHDICTELILIIADYPEKVMWTGKVIFPIGFTTHQNPPFVFPSVMIFPIVVRWTYRTTDVWKRAPKGLEDWNWVPSRHGSCKFDGPWYMELVRTGFLNLRGQKRVSDALCSLVALHDVVHMHVSCLGSVDLRYVDYYCVPIHVRGMIDVSLSLIAWLIRHTVQATVL